jgi:hypothetical protein
MTEPTTNYRPTFRLSRSHLELINTVSPRISVPIRARTHKFSLPSPACSMSSFPRVRHRTHFIRAALPMRWTVRVAWGITEAVLNADWVKRRRLDLLLCTLC